MPQVAHNTDGEVADACELFSHRSEVPGTGCHQAFSSLRWIATPASYRSFVLLATSCTMTRASEIPEADAA
jgi:hypothetical protein